MNVEDWFEANRRNWDDRAAIHAASETYALEWLLNGQENISDVVAFDRPALGDVDGLSTLHLQCHIGTDTLSLARLGADVVGYDFSGTSLAIARELCRAAGAPVEFVEGNVYDAPANLGRRFDLVYTTVGAINWLPDIGRWAEVVAELLEPGGRVFLRDTHPAAYPLEEEDGRLVHRYPYWHARTDPVVFDETTSYTEGPGTIEHTRNYEWNHPLASIINAVIDQGLIIDRMQEYDSLEWQLVPMMTRHDDGRWYLPAELRDKVPLMFSLTAHMPKTSNS